MASPATDVAPQPWTLALDLQLIATIREHLRCDEWHSDDHGDLPWKRLFAKSQFAWPDKWTKHELAMRWTHAYRRWLPPPPGTVGRAQRVNLTRLEALVKRRYAAEHKRGDRKRPAPEEEGSSERRQPSSGLLSEAQEEHVQQWLPILRAAAQQGRCHIRIGAHELELDWLVTLLLEETGDVPIEGLEARYLALAGVIVPNARLALAPQSLHVSTSSNGFPSGEEYEVYLSAATAIASVPHLGRLAPPVSSRRQMLQVGLYVALPSTKYQELHAWPAGLATLLWWHLLSQPNVSIVLPPPSLPLPFTTLTQVTESLGLRIQQPWVTQSLAVLPLAAAIACLADTFASERQFELLSLPTTTTLAPAVAFLECYRWRDRSKALTVIAERAQHRFGVALTLSNADDGLTVACPSPRSITRFQVNGTACDFADSPLQLRSQVHRVEFCVAGLTVCIDAVREPPVSLVSAHTPSSNPDGPAMPGTAAQFAPLFALAHSAPPPEAILDVQPISGSSESAENGHRKRARELLALHKSKAAEKLLRELWSAARAPDNNLGVATVGPSPQKQTLVRVILCTNLTLSQRSGVSVLLAMGVNATSRFLDIGTLWVHPFLSLHQGRVTTTSNYGSAVV